VKFNQIIMNGARLLQKPVDYQSSQAWAVGDEP
jgi:hypothetical protein